MGGISFTAYSFLRVDVRTLFPVVIVYNHVIVVAICQLMRLLVDLSPAYLRVVAMITPQSWRCPLLNCPVFFPSFLLEFCSTRFDLMVFGPSPLPLYLPSLIRETICMQADGLCFYYFSQPSFLSSFNLSLSTLKGLGLCKCIYKFNMNFFAS